MSKRVLAPIKLADKHNMGVPFNLDADFRVVNTQFIDNIGVVLTVINGGYAGTLYLQGAMERDGNYFDITPNPGVPNPNGTISINLNQYAFPILYIGWDPQEQAPAAATLLSQATILYTAVGPGVNGDLISVNHLDPGVPNSPLNVTVGELDNIGNLPITVSLATDGSSNLISTADDVIEAMLLSEAAVAFVTPSLVGAGSTIIADSGGPVNLGSGFGAGGYLTIEVCGKEI